MIKIGTKESGVEFCKCANICSPSELISREVIVSNKVLDKFLEDSFEEALEEGIEITAYTEYPTNYIKEAWITYKVVINPADDLSSVLEVVDIDYGTELRDKEEFLKELKRAYSCR